VSWPERKGALPTLDGLTSAGVGLIAIDNTPFETENTLASAAEVGPQAGFIDQELVVGSVVPFGAHEIAGFQGPLAKSRLLNSSSKVGVMADTWVLPGWSVQSPCPWRQRTRYGDNGALPDPRALRPASREPPLARSGQAGRLMTQA